MITIVTRHRLIPSSLLLIALAVFAVVAAPVRAGGPAAQDTGYRYTLVDLGTLGGPATTISGPGVTILNHQGLITALGDTPISDTDYLKGNPGLSQDPYIQHTFLWHDGVRTDLGALPGSNSSGSAGINAWGDVVGQSENGVLDPFTGLTAMTAVLWRNGKIIPLGTLPGGFEGLAIAINDAGQAVGFATNGKADPYCIIYCLGAQTRAVRWGNDANPQSLGTLGGPDSFAGYENNRGQIAGASYTSAISNSVTGQPPQDPFLWQDGQMTDLGTLGGSLGYPNAMNNAGQVVGTMNLAGDTTHHGFLWSQGRLSDLGTFGGDQSTAWSINDGGDVAGNADVPGSQSHHAVLWKDGSKTDLGLLPGQPCSTAYAVNNHDQVVGDTGICGKGGGPPFLWEHGTILDLRSLVAPTDLQLVDAWEINDRGEIAGTATLPTGEHHAVLFVPNTGTPGRSPPPGMPTTGVGAGSAELLALLGTVLALLLAGGLLRRRATTRP